MRKEIQGLAWKCLPKETRQLCRNMNRTSGDGNVEFLLDELFGHHNITSDEEPSELLFVDRERAQNLIKSLKTIDDYTNGIRYCAKTLFGNKCLPDTEPSAQDEPRFRKGDRVRVLTDVWDEVHTVVEVKGIYPQFIYKLSCSTVGCMLNPRLNPTPNPKQKTIWKKKN